MQKCYMYNEGLFRLPFIFYLFLCCSGVPEGISGMLKASKPKGKQSNKQTQILCNNSNKRNKENETQQHFTFIRFSLNTQIKFEN